MDRGPGQNRFMTKAGERSCRKPRRGLSQTGAAVYVGIGVTKLDEMVADGRMPHPKRIDGRKVWDTRASDLPFNDLSDEPVKNFTGRRLQRISRVSSNSQHQKGRKQ